MCRWLAYTGAPILLRDALHSPGHALIDQSLRSRVARTTNGDGFGIGWYGSGPDPGVFRSVEPAWSDPNLRELAGHVSSRLFFAHIRASSGTAVQRTNCHPFRHGRWLWMHNGLISDFSAIKRDLVLDVDPSLFPYIEGQTDSEVLFFLALTLGLDDDPPAGVGGAVGLVEAAGRRRGIEHPFQGTIAVSDGKRLWVFRYSSEGRSRSLLITTDVSTLRRMYPHTGLLGALSDETRLVVSEPLEVPPGAWQELPEASYAVIAGADVAIERFVPLRSSRPQRPAHLAGSWLG
jgi:predicted glutamine amidotransferase